VRIPVVIIFLDDFMSYFYAFLLVIALSLVGVLGDYFIKLSGDDKTKYIDYKLFIIGFVVYSLTAVGWFFVMKNIKLGTLGVIYGVTTILALVIVGVLFFNERLNAYEIAGIVAGLFSLALLYRFG